MQGSVRKRGKTWGYYFYTGKDASGKKIYKEVGGFKTKGAASTALNEALVDFESLGFVKDTQTTLLTFSLDWLENYVKPLRKVGTYNRYKGMLNKQILPSMGHLAVTDITSHHVEQLLFGLGNLSGASKQSVYTLLNTLMNRALKLRLIKENPCIVVERPKRGKFIPETLTLDEISKIVKALNLEDYYDYMFYIGLMFVLETGKRRGELGGVEWSDINFSEKSVFIHNNLTYTDGKVLMETTKTDESTMKMYVSDRLLNMLQELQKRQKETRLLYGEFYEHNIWGDKKYDLVMRWQNGRYIHPDYYLKKLTKMLKKVGIKKHVRFHDIRHTNATLLLEQGVDFKTIQVRLGHKDINTTLNIYSHVTEKMQKVAVEKLNDILNF